MEITFPSTVTSLDGGETKGKMEIVRQGINWHVRDLHRCIAHFPDDISPSVLSVYKHSTYPLFRNVMEEGSVSVGWKRCMLCLFKKEDSESTLRQSVNKWL